MNINVFEIFLVFFLLQSNIIRPKQPISYLSKITSSDMLYLCALCLRGSDTYNNVHRPIFLGYTCRESRTE